MWWTFFTTTGFCTPDTIGSGQAKLQYTVVSRYTEPLLYRTFGYTGRIYLETEFIFVTESYSLHQTSGCQLRFFQN